MRSQIPDQGLPIAVQRLRQDAIEDHFNSGKTQFYSTDELGLPLDPASQRGMADRSMTAHQLAKTSMPLQHLNGMQFMHVIRAGLEPDTLGKYNPRTRTMAAHGLDHPDPAQNHQLLRTYVHETGHHVENMTHGGMAHLGPSEAMAENYADQHMPSIPVTHMGVTVPFKPSSNYDTHVPVADSGAWAQERGGPTADVNRRQYVQTRAKGTMPDEH